MKSGLGKGLGALIPTEETYDNISEENINEVKINQVEPNKNQPRKSFDQDKLLQMSESIKAHGIIQPIVVRKINDKYEIIAGERRWRAARIAGLEKVPIVIKELTDKQLVEAALIENLQREDLNAIEEALGYERLINEFKLTQESVSKIIGKSRSAIANILRLLYLDERVKRMISTNQISSGHARALVVVQDKDFQYEIAKKIVDNELSVRETEKLLTAVENKKQVKKKENNPIYIDLEDELKSILGTKVKISNNKNKGKIEIEYYSNDDLDRIMSILKGI